MVKKKKLTIGRSDKIDLPDLNLMDVPAKVDTGAYTSSIHCARIRYKEKEGEKIIYFTIPNAGKQVFSTKDFKQKNIKNSFGQIEKRFIIKTRVIIFNKTFKVEFSLSDRTKMRYPVLIGRKLLKRRFIVDVSAINLSFKLKS